MPYQSELQFLTRTLQKSRVLARVIPSHALAEELSREGLGSIPGFPHQDHALPVPEARTRYHYVDAYDLCYIYLLLPHRQPEQLLLIGPYLRQAPRHEQVLELAEQLGISPEALPHLEEYVSGAPVLDKESPLFLMLDTFCECIWHSPSFAIVNVDSQPVAPASPIHQPLHTDRFDDVLLDMKAMEQRYAYENELIRAVSLGQLHMENHLFSAVADQHFERRVADPVRNAKNYGISMNTLLRKAAESGGVHPLYIDRVSSDFARRIEQISNLGESSTLMQDMFRGYCTLVRQHSLSGYSHVVQTAILLIDSDLSANLTLHSLAEHQGVSPGYLSTVFKKETGRTVTAYIREKRMRHARHLLGTTNLQIQTVAMYCGILDVHFFSKLFKKETGMTPKQYRQSIVPARDFSV